MKKDGTDERGDCFVPDKESGEAADESRVELDRYHAALSYIFYLRDLMLAGSLDARDQDLRRI
jgi:hypothetical protein